MDEKEIIESLSPIERKVLPLLSLDEKNIDVIVTDEIDKTTILRAIGFLANKNLIDKKEKELKIIDLGIFGIQYAKTGLPERKLLNTIVQKKELAIKDIKSATKLNDNEAKVSLGTLKRKGLVEIRNGILTLSAQPSSITNKSIEENLLEKLPTDFDSLNKDDKEALNNLINRKDIVEIKEQKETFVKLTELGEKIASLNFKEDLIEQLTPKILKSNLWTTKKFRRYDITLPVPKIYGGKRHFVNQATDYAKKIWLDMGFKEMTGNMVITGFYNFDALFTAQDHPVREMQDTFFIKGITGKLPDKEIVNETKKAHEGKCAGSKGWCEKWREEDAKKVLLRTHTTPWSVQTLYKIAKTKEMPAKYFALGKCFRNETVDWSHGFEFNQTEGIVVDENANFRQLLGYLKQFFKKMGYDNLRIRPAYFPYTEPSLEIDVYNPVHKSWVELGGAGMFRPEVTVPIFGKHVPVLAWGPGFDRIITQFYKINDLRDMYKNNITQLRDMKFWDM
jgi:phenylalanyl-tRNA synthetase alpha chain